MTLRVIMLRVVILKYIISYIVMLSLVTPFCQQHQRRRKSLIRLTPEPDPCDVFRMVLGVGMGRFRIVAELDGLESSCTVAPRRGDLKKLPFSEF
jgi:hypothetical protein